MKKSLKVERQIFGKFGGYLLRNRRYYIIHVCLLIYRSWYITRKNKFFNGYFMITCSSDYVCYKQVLRFPYYLISH